MKVDKKQIIYAGIENPTTAEEVHIEIAGLKNAQKQAEELISRFEQILLMISIEQREQANHEHKTTNQDSAPAEASEDEPEGKEPDKPA